MKYLGLIICCLSSIASANEWKSASLKYIVYSNDTAAYANQPVAFQASVCSADAKKCERLATSAPFTFKGNDKAFEAQMEATFSNADVSRALAKLGLSSKDAYFSFGPISLTHQLTGKEYTRSGPLESYLMKAGSSQQADIYFYNKHSGTVEVSYVLFNLN